MKNLNYYFFLKIFISILLLILSIFLIYNGYSKIDLTLRINQDEKIDLTDTNITIDKSKNINKSLTVNNIFLNNNKSIEKEIQILNEIEVVVKKNETFSIILDKFINNQKIKNSLINKLNQEINLKYLKIGQLIYFYEDEKNIINKIIIPLDNKNEIEINIRKNSINLKKQKIKLLKEFEAKKFVIKSSLYEDGKKTKIPLTILFETIKLFSFDVDFQRDIQKNDELEVFYEIFYNEKRNTKSFGNILYIKLKLQKTNLEYFLFLDEEGYFDYYNKEGKNVRKALLKTPLDGARLSSSFGMRKHPISGFNKLHKGVDFAAPKGTPVYAGGNGVVEMVGRNGGYGKYIRIRHNNSYKTAYAHLNNYKKGIHKGSRVNQGDIIGYVGSTGNSTGPHLHYEIIYQGKQINPMKMKLPSGKVLKGKELEKFKQSVKNIYSDFLFYMYE